MKTSVDLELVSAETPVVRVEDVWVAYSGSDRPAIAGVSLSIPVGVVVLVTGPNGAGKTTLVDTCLGLLKPLRGRAFLFGIDTRSRRIHEARKLCSYVPQNFMRPPYESYTARRVVELGFAPSKAPFEPLSESEEERVEEVAELLGIEDLLDRPMGTLSGGQQQKVLIARALAREPRALFLDEPFSSLDRESRKLVAEVVEEYAREEKAMAVIVSHDVNPVIGVADAIVRMEEGRVVEVEGLPGG